MSAPAAAAAPFARARLGDVGIDACTEQAVVEHLVRTLEQGEGGWICPVNLDVLRRIDADPTARELVARADLVVADGAPLLWANRLSGEVRLPERVAGSSLTETLSAACATAGRSVFLLGGDPGVAERAGVALQARHPGLRIAGTHCPPFGFEHDPAALAEIERRLAAAEPDLVLVALGFPKQDGLALRLRSRFPRAWFLSCGISLSFAAGDVDRAPRWLQVSGLEWLHRLAQEPRRLFRRYLVEDPPFLAALLARSVGQRVRRGRGLGAPGA